MSDVDQALLDVKRCRLALAQAHTVLATSVAVDGPAEDVAVVIDSVQATKDAAEQSRRLCDGVVLEWFEATGADGLQVGARRYWSGHTKKTEVRDTAAAVSILARVALAGVVFPRVRGEEEADAIFLGIGTFVANLVGSSGLLHGGCRAILRQLAEMTVRNGNHSPLTREQKRAAEELTRRSFDGLFSTTWSREKSLRSSTTRG
jgi:hypothetical protein